MPIYKMDGRNAEGLQKYKIRVKRKDGDQWRSFTRIAYGLRNAKEIESQLMTGGRKDRQTDDTITLDALFAEYTESNRKALRRSSLAVNTKIYANYIRPHIGSYRLSALTAQSLQKWKNSINDLPLALVTKQNIYTVLNIILNYAVKYDHMPANPLPKVGTFKDSNVIKEEMQVYTPRQWLKYRDCARHYVEDHPEKYDFYVFFNLRYYSGARKGEIQALKWSSLIDNRMLSIRSAIHQERGRDIETPPKNTASVRTIEMPQPLIDVLDGHWFRVIKMPEYTDDWYICGCNKTLRNTSIDQFNRKIAEIAGLPHIRVHDFRHTHRSTLINAGVPVIEISKRLGHSTIEQTLNTYSHLFKETSQASLNVLNRIK